MGSHWKVLAWMAAGVLVGLGLQAWAPGGAWIGLAVEARGEGLAVVSAEGPAAAAGLAPGEVLVAAVAERGKRAERRSPLREPADLEAALAAAGVGDVLWLVARDAPDAPRAVALALDPGSPRALALKPIDVAAQLFLALLKLLIVPIVFTSIVTGVSGLGRPADLGRIGGRTLGYYALSSLLAILVGQTLVNLVKPGRGAELGLAPVESLPSADSGLGGFLLRMVPTNAFEALADNGAMLQIILLAILLGMALTRTPEPHGGRVRALFEGLFEAVMAVARGVLALLPYGVFALIARTVAGTGFGVFKPLLVYMATVTAALLIHALVTLPLLLRLLAKVSPVRWFQAMSPALVTAFSTSSSSMTLPVTLRTVEERGRVSNRVGSFTLPLGATVNMDGTALYECIGVIFLAQYYGSTSGYVLTFGGQLEIVLLALLASVGAAGIPSAGLVMMLTILSALDLPLEGAALLLAIDRPLDMLRTVVNVWSDTCGAAVVARGEGESAPGQLGREAVEGSGEGG